MTWIFRCGVLTVEIEHVDAATLEKLEQQGVDCQPKASTIRIIQVLSDVMCNFTSQYHIGYILAERMNILMFLFLFDVVGLSIDRHVNLNTL